MDLEYKLSELDAIEIDRIAGCRNASKKPEWTRRKSSKYSDHQIDRMGMIGELVFERVFGWKLDRVTRVDGDDGVDFVVSGVSIAIKFNHRVGGYLLVEEYEGDVPRKRLKDIDRVSVIVLVQGDCRPPLDACKCKSDDWWRTTARISGWVTRREFLAKSERADWGLGPRWFMRQECLHKHFNENWYSRPRTA